MSNQPNDESARERRHATRFLMLAVTVWGSILALGAMLFGVDRAGNLSFSVNLSRGLIVFVCVMSFVGFWAIMLKLRASKLRNKRETQ